MSKISENDIYLYFENPIINNLKHIKLLLIIKLIIKTNHI